MKSASNISANATTAGETASEVLVADDSGRWNPERMWRAFATALCFILFGLGGLLLGVTVYPLLSLCVRDPIRRTHLARRFTGATCRFFVAFMKTVGVLDWHCNAVPSAAELKGCVIVANHPSLIDVLFLIGLFPQANCIVKDAIWNNIVTRWSVRASSYISNYEPEDLLRNCQRRLEDGGHLLIFPEGSRTPAETEPVFKRGAAVIALRANGSCLPISIRCEPSTLTKGEAWYRIPASKVMLNFSIHQRIIAADAVAESGDERRASRALTEQLRSTILSSLPANPA